MNREQRRQYKLTKEEAEDKELKFKMVAFAELYIQNPEADCFKNFKSIEKVKLLAEELKKVRAEGKLL